MIVGEILVGEAERAFADLLTVVGIDEVPVDILDLSYGGDYLGLESKIGDLGVALGNTDKALVGGDPEAGQNGLGDYQLKIGVQLRIDEVVRGVTGDTLTDIVDVYVGADGERLGVARQYLNGVGLQSRHAGRYLVGLLGDGVIDIALEGEVGIEGRNAGAGAESRGDDAACACGKSRSRRAASAASGSTKTALCRLDYGGVDAVGRAACFGAQDIGLSDGEVIAEIGQIEVVFDGHCDGVPQ